MTVKRILYIFLLLTLIFFVFNQKTYAEDINSEYDLLQWYNDVNREYDVFKLTDDIYINTSVLFDREDDTPITIETGEFSIIFDPVSTRFNITVDDDELTITGNETVVNIKNGYFNFLEGTIKAVGDNAVAVNCEGVINVDGGKIISEGDYSICLNAEYVVNLNGGEIFAYGNNTKALKIGKFAEVSKQQPKYVNNHIKINAKGINAVSIDNTLNNEDVFLSNFEVSAEGEGSLSIHSNADVIAVYSVINGDMNFESDNQITTYFSDVSHKVYENSQEYIISYPIEEISLNQKVPDKQYFSIDDTNGKELGKFVANIIWDDKIGELDTFVKSEIPLIKKVYYYELTETDNCDFKNLISWYENAQANDVYTLTGDIIIEEPYSFEGSTPLSVDTGNYTIFLRDELNIVNENLKIVGEGNELGVICIENDSYNAKINMPNGGEITAKNGFAVFSMHNLAFGGMPTISSIKLANDAYYISGVEILDKVETQENLFFANCILRGEVVAPSWIYALSIVPEGNEDKEIDIEYYNFDTKNNKNIVGFKNETDLILPKRYYVNARCNNSILPLAISVDWDKENIQSVDFGEIGSYKISGMLNGLDDEQPSLNIDIINKDKMTILGEGANNNRYKDARIYFKLPENVPVEYEKTFFELQYARGSIENGANFGTIAPTYPEYTGYDTIDLEYPIDGYAMILLDELRNEYGLLTEDEYCFRVKTSYEDKIYYSDEIWFPNITENEDDNAELPSSPEEDLNIGGRGGGNRDSWNNTNHIKVTSQQVENLINAGKEQYSFIIDKITIILSQEFLKELQAQEFHIYAEKKSDTLFEVYLIIDNQDIKRIEDKIKIQLPYSGGTNTICKVNGDILQNSYANEKKYNIKTNTLGTFEILESENISYYDVVNHWASDVISFVGVRKIAYGSGNGYFRPDDLILENEFKKMLDSILYSDTIYFDANKNSKILRQDIALMLYNEYGDDKTFNSSSYVDTSKMSTNYINAIEFVTNKGLMKGKDKNIFAPNDFLTRAEAAQVIHNAVQCDL